MTVQVNLLPSEYHWRARRGRRLKMWGCLCAAALIGQLLLAGVIRHLAADTRGRIRQIADMRSDEHALIKRLAELKVDYQAARRRTILAEQLGRKHQWSRVLRCLVDAVPQTAALTRVQTIPPRAETPKHPRKPSQNRALQPDRQPEITHADVARGFVIDGLATDHQSVAALLKGLNDTQRLGTCELLSTQQQRFRGGNAVALSIRSEWP